MREVGRCPLGKSAQPESREVRVITKDCGRDHSLPLARGTTSKSWGSGQHMCDPGKGSVWPSPHWVEALLVTRADVLLDGFSAFLRRGEARIWVLKSPKSIYLKAC